MDAAQQEIVIEEESSQPLVQAYPDAVEQLSNVSHDTERVPKDVFGDGKTLLNYLPEQSKFRAQAEYLKKTFPEILYKDAVTLKKEYREVITLITQRLRISLWQEFESAVLNNRQMRVKQIWAGICTEESFYKLLENPPRLAFILLAPTDYIVTLKEAHEAGLEKLREIFSATVIDDEGILNPKAAEVVIKAFALIDARLKGAIVQRVDQRVLTANLNKALAPKPPEDMETLELELAKARAALVNEVLEAQLIDPRHPSQEELERLTSILKIDKIDMQGGDNQRSHTKVLK